MSLSSNSSEALLTDWQGLVIETVERCVMYAWLREHSYEIGLTAGFLGLAVVMGIAMLDLA